MIRRRGTGRAVSEVISVLFMVAVTIVLAAMVGSVLLNVLGDVDDNPLAGASVTFNSEGDEIRVVYTATQEKGTTLEVMVIDESTDSEVTGSPKTVGEVGESARFNESDGLSDGFDYTVRIVAEAPGGQQAVVDERDGSL